jgi:drug/metabolite transporter (DMT)-like permease
MPCPRLYNCQDTKLLPGANPNPTMNARPRRWTVLGAGLLLAALSLVVVYTGRGAFFSPQALVVVAAIGLAALLLQLRLRQRAPTPVRAPLWLNVLGIVFAIVALFADLLRLRPNLTLLAALGAILCFGVSGVVVLNALRKQRSERGHQT